MTKSILDPAFKYTHSSNTTPEYLREKFARIAAEQAAANAKKTKVTFPHIVAKQRSA